MDEVTSIMLSQIKEVEERDEGQILAELAGETIEEFIYEIPAAKGRKRTVKLSWAGTREMGRARGNIALSDPIIEDHDGFVRISSTRHRPKAQLLGVRRLPPAQTTKGKNL